MDNIFFLRLFVAIGSLQNITVDLICQEKLLDVD